MSREPLLSVEAARDAVFAAIDGPTPVEIAWLIEARGRVLAEPVTSPIALPPWDNSAMDGYAIRAADVGAATDDAPVRLEVIGEVRAGQAPDVTVRRGTAVRIATGAPVPSSADAVVPVEETTPLDASGAARRPARPGRDRPRCRPASSSTPPRPGRRLDPAGRQRPRGGNPDPRGRHRPHAGDDRPGGRASVSTSSASIAGRSSGSWPPATRCARPGRDLGPAGIPDANGPGLVAMVEAAGGDPRVLGIAKDRLDDVKSRICAGLIEGADALIVSGGVSVGPYDVVRAAFEAFGTVRPLAGRGPAGQAVRVRHGTGARHGRGRRARPPALLFGLPGNPVSTFVTFELFVRPAIRRLAGHRDDDLFRPRDRAVLAGPVTKSRGRRAFVRVTVERDEHGTPAPRRARPRPREPGRRPGRSGQPRAVGAGDRPTRWPSSPRPTTACPAAPRSSCGGSTGPDALPGAASRPLSSGRDGPQTRPAAPTARRAPPAHPRRSRRPAAHGRRLGQARHRPARRRRGDGLDVGRDAQPRHRWRRAEGRRPRRRRAGRGDGRQADQRADPALPSAGR